MSGSSPLNLVGRTLGAAHLLGAAVPLLFVAVALFQAARFGFQPAVERYGRVQFNRVAGTEAIVNSILAEARENNYPPEKIRVGIWGLAERPGGPISEEAAGVYIARALRREGIQVRAHDPRLADQARALLGGEVQVVEDPLAAAASNILILACEEEEYADMDWEAVGEAMYQPRFVFDCRSLFDIAEVTASGRLRYADLGNPRYELWQDPDLEPWLEMVRLATREDSRILFLPANLYFQDAPPPTTASPRSRYFLAVNYLLLPRQMYLYEPVLASGTVAQYQAWVEEVRGRGLLSEAEKLESVRSTGFDHLVAFAVDQDFRKEDWQLGKADVRFGQPRAEEEGQ